MPIWRLTPIAPPDDPRWLDHQIWESVLVRAPTSGMALLLASELERDPDRPPVGNETPSFQSAFEDPKLYVARRVDEPFVGVSRGRPGILSVMPSSSKHNDDR